MNYFVYALIDPRNDLPFYIGKGQIKDASGRYYRRITEHQKNSDESNPLKKSVASKIFKKLKKIPFKIIKDKITEKEAFDLEISLIKKYGRRDNRTGILTNLTDGGEGISGYEFTPEQKNKISIKNKEYYQHNENPFLGKKHTKQSRKRMSKSQKKRFKDSEPTFLGRKHTEESRKKMSDIAKTRGNTLPKEEWYKYGRSGAENKASKTYLFISPNGEVFKVTGEFKKFIQDNALALTICKKFVDKGVIPTHNAKHNRLTQERINSSGWEIRKLNA